MSDETFSEENVSKEWLWKALSVADEMRTDAERERDKARGERDEERAQKLEARRLAEELRDELVTLLNKNTFGQTSAWRSLPWEVEK